MGGTGWSEPEEHRAHRVFVTGSGLAESAQRYLAEQNCIVATGDPRDTPEEIAEKLRSFRPDGLIVRQGKITTATLDAVGGIKVICKHGVGTDNIDIEAASARGIPVMYTPNANFEAVAQHSLALLLALARCIPSQDRRIRGGTFDKSGYDGFELGGKTLGLIGFGRVGRRFAELVAPLGMRVIFHDPLVRAESWPGEAERVDSVERVYSESDILSLHCPLTEETKGLINSRSIELMKEGVCLINTARGGLVVETDLVLALERRRVGGAALDVFQVEPPPPANPLFALENTVVTAHIAGSSDESLMRMGRDAVDNVLSVLRGEGVDAGSLLNAEAVPWARTS